MQAVHPVCLCVRVSVFVYLWIALPAMPVAVSVAAQSEEHMLAPGGMRCEPSDKHEYIV